MFNVDCEVIISLLNIVVIQSNHSSYYHGLLLSRATVKSFLFNQQIWNNEEFGVREDSVGYRKPYLNLIKESSDNENSLN